MEPNLFSADPRVAKEAEDRLNLRRDAMVNMNAWRQAKASHNYASTYGRFAIHWANRIRATLESGIDQSQTAIY